MSRRGHRGGVRRSTVAGMDRGFSFASVILSYFLVAGGLLTGTFVTMLLSSPSQNLAFALAGAGAFVGGFIAARASPGSTIIEPAIGAVAVIGTIVAIIISAAGTSVWHVAPDELKRFAGIYAATAVVGALVGAFLSEKVLGESTTSSLPWLVYAAFATYGACTMATLVAIMLVLSGERTSDDLGKMMLAGMGAGCLLSGLAIGASARTRPLIASLVGGGGGVAVFVALLTHDSRPQSHDAVDGILFLVIGGGIVTLVGALVGWLAVGRRNAAPSREPTRRSA
jgi:hypothetical protein